MKKGLDSSSILKEAIKIVNEEGLQALSMASLANQVGVRTPSLYNHVKGLEDLYRMIAVFGIVSLRDTLQFACVGKSGDESFLSLGFAYVDFVRKNKGIYECTIGVCEDETFINASEDMIRLISTLLVPYDLTEIQTIHAIRSLRSIVHGFASLEANGGFQMGVDVDETLSILLKTFLNGLKT